MSFNPQSLLALLQNKDEYSSADKSWLKLTAGQHRIRILPPWSDEQQLTRQIVNHQGYLNKDGRKRNPLCFHYVFNHENIVNALFNKKRKVITQKCLETFKQVGCVFCRVSEIKRQMEGKDAGTASKGKVSFLWNVVHRSVSLETKGPFKWSTGGTKFLEFITPIAQVYRNFTDLEKGLDIYVSATGEGIARRYEYVLINEPISVGIDLNVTPLYDLDEAMADGYQTIDNALQLITHTYPQMMQYLGIMKNV